MFSSSRQKDLYAGEDLDSQPYRPNQAGFLKRLATYAALALGLATMGDWKEAYSDETGEPQKIERSDPTETRITAETDLGTVFKYLREGYVLGSRDPKDYRDRDLAFFNGIYTRANNAKTFEEAKGLFEGVLKETSGLADANLVKEAQKAFREYASSHKKGENMGSAVRRELALKTTGIVQNYMQAEEAKRWAEAGVDYGKMTLAGVPVEFVFVPGGHYFVGTNDMEEIKHVQEVVARGKTDGSMVGLGVWFSHVYPEANRRAVASEYNGEIPENNGFVGEHRLEGDIIGIEFVPSFWIMETEVTNRLYKEFLTAPPTGP